MKARRKILSLMLAVLMVLSMMPTIVYADGIVTPSKGQVYNPGKSVEIKIKTEYYEDCDEDKNYVEVRVFAVTNSLVGWVMNESLPYTAKGQTVKTTFKSDTVGNYYIYYSHYYKSNGFKHYIEDSRNWYMLPQQLGDEQTIWASGTTNFKISNSVLKLDKSSLNIVCGQTASLKATLQNSSSQITWKSADKKVATVDSSGKITAKQAGATVISASADGLIAECKLQVLYKDVTNSSDFWYTPTNYLTAKGVVKGYANQTEFRPANECTRAQMVTFLYRLQGEPKTKSTTCKFDDV